MLMWKEPVMLCDNLKCQAVTTIYMDTRSQSYSIDSHRLPRGAEIQPCQQAAAATHPYSFLFTISAW